MLNSDRSLEKILYGVPQGSVLGPIIFKIYVNDIVYASEILLKLVLFADETNILYSSANDECAKNTVKIE